MLYSYNSLILSGNGTNNDTNEPSHATEIPRTNTNIDFTPGLDTTVHSTTETNSKFSQAANTTSYPSL